MGAWISYLNSFLNKRQEHDCVESLINVGLTKLTRNGRKILFLTNRNRDRSNDIINHFKNNPNTYLYKIKITPKIRLHIYKNYVILYFSPNCYLFSDHCLYLTQFFSLPNFQSCLHIEQILNCLKMFEKNDKKTLNFHHIYYFN